LNITLITNNLGNSQINYDMIRKMNSHPENSNAALYQNIIPPVVEPFFLTSNCTAVSSLTGVAIACDLESASVLQKAGCRTTNVLYLADLEWMFVQVNYLAARNLIDKFDYIYSRSKEHARAMFNYLGRDVEVVDSVEGLYDKCLTIAK